MNKDIQELILRKIVPYKMWCKKIKRVNEEIKERLEYAGGAIVMKINETCINCYVEKVNLFWYNWRLFNLILIGTERFIPFSIILCIIATIRVSFTFMY